jgi:hypothetical protein
VVEVVELVFWWRWSRRLSYFISRWNKINIRIGGLLSNYSRSRRSMVEQCSGGNQEILQYFQQLHRIQVVVEVELIMLLVNSQPGGSGGRWRNGGPNNGGAGNTPPVSPPQGNPGGTLV